MRRLRIGMALLAVIGTAHGQLIYSSRVYQTKERSRLQLWELNLKTGARKQLTASDRPHMQPVCVAAGVEYGTSAEPVEPVPPEASERWLWERAGGKERKLGPTRAAARSHRPLKEASFSKDGKEVVITHAATKKVLLHVPAPKQGEHWEIPSGFSWSPDAGHLVAFSLGGTSTAHYMDMWLLDEKKKSWTYLDAGNDLAWSADGTRLFYVTPRDLAPLPGGKQQVWVTELRMIRVSSLARQTLVSGLAYNAWPTWCVQ